MYDPASAKGTPDGPTPYPPIGNYPGAEYPGAAPGAYPSSVTQLPGAVQHHVPHRAAGSGADPNRRRNQMIGGSLMFLAGVSAIIVGYSDPMKVTRDAKLDFVSLGAACTIGDTRIISSADKEIKVECPNSSEFCGGVTILVAAVENPNSCKTKTASGKTKSGGSTNTRACYQLWCHDTVQTSFTVKSLDGTFLLSPEEIARSSNWTPNGLPVVRTICDNKPRPADSKKGAFEARNDTLPCWKSIAMDFSENDKQMYHCNVDQSDKPCVVLQDPEASLDVHKSKAQDMQTALYILGGAFVFSGILVFLGDSIKRTRASRV